MVELTESEERRAMELHRESLVVDTHCDTLMQLMPQPFRGESRKLGERSERGHIDLPRLVEGGVDCQSFAIYTGRQENQPGALKTALQMVDVFNRECKANAGITPICSYDDIMKANEAKKVGALLAIE